MRLERPSTRRERRRNRALAIPNADGSPLEGFVEVPADGEGVDRLTIVSGWHTWEGEPVAGVSIELDGRLVGGAGRSREARDDVAAERGAPYARAGWVADLDLRAVAGDTATIRVTVHPAVDRPGVVLDPVTVRVLGERTIDDEGEPIPPPDEVRGRLDAPIEGSTVRGGALLVRGWARSTSGAPITRVDLSIGGRSLGRARLGLDRVDVAVADDAWDAPICGFEQLVDVSGLGAGPARLTATAVALDGIAGALDVDLSVAPDDRVPEPIASPVASRAPDSFSLLVFAHDLGVGGAQWWLVEALRQMGAGSAFPCDVVAFASGPLRAVLERLGIGVHVSSPLPVRDLDGYEGRLQELDGWLAHRGHTVALVNTFRAFAGADLAQRRGLPVVWAIHESWPEPLIWAFDHPGATVDPAVRAAASRALARAGAVVFEADATRALYASRAPGRTLVVPYGVDTAALADVVAGTTREGARRALGLDAGRRTLLVMGTIEPRKCQAVLVAAFAQLAEHHDDVDLALVGDLGTPYSAAIQTAVSRAGLTDRVQLVPVTEDAATWYRACDALVCGSDVESLPRSVLDAMAVGLPVISTSVFGLGELLEDGVTALCFEANDLASAISAIDRACETDPAALAAIGRRGRELVRTRHDARDYAADVLALLRGLDADPQADPQTLLADRSGGAGRAAQSVRS